LISRTNAAVVLSDGNLHLQTSRYVEKSQTLDACCLRLSCSAQYHNGK